MSRQHQGEDQTFPGTALSSHDEETRRAAVAALSDLPLRETRKRLLVAMGDESWRVRKEAVEAFAASPEAGDFAEELFELLRSQDNAGQRNSSVEALVRLGTAAVPVLAAHADDPDGDVRKFVIDILGGIGDPSTLPLLIRALDDPDPNVRAAAAENLGATGGASAVPPLLAALARQDLVLRHTILEALAKTGGPVPTAAVEPFLTDGLLKKTVYRCLGSAGSEDAASVLVKGLWETTRGVRETAVRAIADFRDRSGARAVEEMDALLESCRGTPVVDGLLTLMETSDQRLLRALVTLLGVIGDARAAGPVLRACGSESLLPECLRALQNMGADIGFFLEREFAGADEIEKANILRICGELGVPGARSLIGAGMDAPAPQVREAAVRAAGKTGLAEFVPRAAALLWDLDQEVRAASLEALVLLAGVAAVDVAGVASSLTAASEPELRRTAACLCGALRDEERLALLMKDEDAQVRKSAVQGMAALDCADAAHHLILSLTDENPEVRIAAATALGENCREEALEPLALVTSDEDPWVRCAAIRSLGRIGGPRALEVIEKSLRHADGLVSLAALDALSRIEGERSLELIRAAASSGDDEVVKAAIAILAERGDRWLDDHVEALLRHPHWDVRNAAVRFLGQRGGREAVDLLRRALGTEQDDLVRARIQDFLERLA